VIKAWKPGRISIFEVWYPGMRILDELFPFGVAIGIDDDVPELRPVLDIMNLHLRQTRSAT
jgi:hypothetical protein